MKVNVLGTDYTIIKRKYEVDKNFKEMSCDGYCDSAVKEVVICDMSTYPNNSLSSPERNEIIEKQICKHEIVHAFFKAQKR